MCLKNVNINSKVDMGATKLTIDSYFESLKHLSDEEKLGLISRLKKSIRIKPRSTDDLLDELFGSFISSQTADEIIADIEKDRAENIERFEL